MMKRVLIVSPHFPPTNAADMQRVRMVLPYLRKHGVEAEVLVIRTDGVAGPMDPWLEAGIPANVPIHRVKAIGLNWSRIPGLGTLTFRALGALRRKGDELLLEGRFDMVYFSTTQFGIHVLGPRWKKKFGVPFVMDYQDPWVSDYYREHPEVVPPGGRLKYGIASWLGRRQEPQVLRECSGITSVSAAYPEQLAKRYAWLEIRDQPSEIRNIDMTGGASAVRPPDSVVRPLASDLLTLPSLVLPFPGDSRDFERVKQGDIRQFVFDPNDGLTHWVYVGRGGADMALAVRSIFSALANLRPLPSGLRLHFIGTSYAAAGRGVKTIEPLAAEYGLEGSVVEHPDRIPYSQTLRCLLDADALIVPGSDDPGYTASKIYPYLLAEKPLLAVFHEQSSVVELIRKVGGGRVIAFASEDSPEAIGKRISREWIDAGGSEQVVPLDREAFAPYSARAQAAMLVEFWKKCVTTAL